MSKFFEILLLITEAFDYNEQFGVINLIAFFKCDYLAREICDYFLAKVVQLRENIKYRKI